MTTAFLLFTPVAGMQDVLTHLVSLAEAEDKVVRLRVCQLLQLIINNQAGPLQTEWHAIRAEVSV